MSPESGPTCRLTSRLRLEAIGSHHVGDLCRLHQDPVVAAWNAGSWSRDEAESFARTSEQAWRADGVHKWMAYHRETGVLVGRGGLSRMPPGGASTVQIEELLAPSRWVQGHLEVGWALLTQFQNQGYATEIGHEALVVARSVLDATTVICFTELHNRASRAVAERLGMTFAGEITAEGLVEGQDEVAPDAPFAVYAIDLSAETDPRSSPGR